MRRLREGEVPWTDREIVKLQNLWANGLSMAAIGRALNRPKGSIVGKVHRLGLPMRPSPIARRPVGAAAPKPVKKARKPVVRVVTPADTRPQRMAIWSVERDAVIEGGWTKGVLTQDLLRAINALPGPIVTMDRVPIRASRLGLKRPVGYRPIATVNRPVMTQAERSQPDDVVRAPRQVIRPAMVLNLKAACCWPIGTPKTPEFRYCDAPTVKGKPYCLDHCERAFIHLAADRAPRVIIAGGMRVTV